MERSTSLKTLMTQVWRASAPLTGAGLLLLVALAAAIVGLVTDPRTITGAPAWLKPAKFAVSTAIYTFTLACVFLYLPGWRKLRLVVGWTTAVALVVEVAIIDLQAWRGTTSHFNVGTKLDLELWVAMGLAIVLQTLMSVAVAVALWRQPFADRALGWALRLGLSISIFGAASGGLMTGPTAAQLAEARAGGRMTVVGAHTIGAPDGGPGMPLTGWSRNQGDLRVPHFLGLHALQALPLVVFGFRRRRWPDTTRIHLTLTAAASYTLLFVILLWQALRGQSLINPDATTLVAFSTWAVLTALTAWIATARHESCSRTRGVLRDTMLPDQIFAVVTLIALCGWACLAL